MEQPHQKLPGSCDAVLEPRCGARIELHLLLLLLPLVRVGLCLLLLSAVEC